MDARDYYAVARDIARLRNELLTVASDLKFRKLLRVVKANFDPAQPRDNLGRWTEGGGSGGETRTVILGSEFLSESEGEVRFVGSAVTIDYGNALTGIQSIDDSTIALSDTLGRTMQQLDFIPTWTPQVYGTAVHVAFGTQVRLQGIPGIGPGDVEHSFKNDGGDANHGEPGSIRTDVVLRNIAGDIIAIYDVKTGQAGLSPARVRQIRERTGTTSSIPIIELHVLRGASIKARSNRRPIGRVIARFWNPAYQ